MAIQSFVELSALISDLRAKTPHLATAFEQIQEFVNQTSTRLAELEKPIVQDQIDAAAGLPLGYAIITMGNRQFKFEIFDLQ